MIVRHELTDNIKELDSNGRINVNYASFQCENLELPIKLDFYLTMPCTANTFRGPTKFSAGAP